MAHNIYYDEAAMAKAAAKGGHRRAVGGLWDEMGALQAEFLKRQGLRPEHRLLDVGAGARRAGRHLVDYLEPGHYFGADLSRALLDAGYDRELTDAQRARLPRRNLVQTADFDFSQISAPIDAALAQSVFTHLPLNHLRRCLHKLAPVMAPGGRFFVTYFECPDDTPVTALVTHPCQSGDPIVTTDYSDPFHYRADDMAWACRGLDWTFERLGDWGHPRGQLMGLYRRP